VSSANLRLLYSHLKFLTTAKTKVKPNVSEQQQIIKIRAKINEWKPKEKYKGSMNQKELSL
jgi:hypothetical protein